MQSSDTTPRTTKRDIDKELPEATASPVDDPTILVDLVKPPVPVQPNTEAPKGLRCKLLLFTVVTLLIALAALIVAVPLVVDEDESDDQREDPTQTQCNSLDPESELTVQNELDCKNNASLFDLTAPCESSVAAMSALHAGLGTVPDHFKDYQNYNPVKQEGDFNVSTYLDVLDHLSLSKGDILDYVYAFDGMGGHPIIYVRGQNATPFLTAEDYRSASCKKRTWCPHYMDKIIPDKTPASYMQTATLDIMGGQFYLWWHAAYNDEKVICSADALDEIFQEFGTNSSHWLYDPSDDPEEQEFVLDKQEHQALLDAGIKPTVQCDDDNAGVVQVSVVTFTKWGGFYRKNYSIDGRVGANRIVESKYENLVSFQVGFVY